MHVHSYLTAHTKTYADTWSRISRLAGPIAVAGAVTAAVLVGASPANADITVDSAVCLNNATVYTENPNPVTIRPNYPYVYWNVTLPTACRTANASLFQTINGVRYHAEPAEGGYLTESGTLVLTLQTSMSSRNLASFSVTVLNPPQ